MSVPFREEEAAALARAESLEIENQDLREQLEHHKDALARTKEKSRAVARAEALESENRELREEVERLKDRIGLNRDAYLAMGSLLLRAH